MENKAFILHSANNARIEPYPMPGEPKSDEVLCKTLTVGICGSDVHYLKEGRCGDFVVKEPMILGHETAAKIVSVGSNVTSLKPGDLVAVEPTIPCEKCEWCLKDLYNLCPNISCHATPPHHGTLQNYFLHPAKYCFKTPEYFSVEMIAMVEPLAVAVHVGNRVKFSENTVLITGAGTIGLLMLQVAKTYGAKRVVVTEINEYRLNLAKELGADDILLFDRNTTEQEMISRIQEAFGNNFPDVSLECSGAGVNFRLVMLATKLGGTCMFIGLGPNEYKLPIASASTREITMLGSFRYKNCFPKAISLLASGQINIQPIITHRFNFENSVQAYEMAARAEGIKVLIDVNSS